MVIEKETRQLSSGEISALQKIIKSSGSPSADKMLALLPVARVRRVNDDGSILAFDNGEASSVSSKQRIFGRAGYVEDREGTAGEVLLFVDEAMNPVELEIVSTGLETIGNPMWETFKLAD